MQEDRSRRFSDDRKLQRRLLRVCRKGKRNCLLFSFLAVFLLFFGSIIHIRRQNRTAEEQYQILMESSQTEELVSAIRLFPDREAAYQKLLQIDLLDQVFTREESRKLEEILGSWGEKLEKEAYGDLAYELGIAYWYYFQQAEGKNYAGVWFERALEGGLTPERQKKAKIYRELGSYCEKKTRQELSGEGALNWKGFFEAICACCVENSQESVPALLRERLQEELLSLCYDGLLYFRDNGITETELQELVEELKNMAPGKQAEAFSVTGESVQALYAGHTFTEEGGRKDEK